MPRRINAAGLALIKSFEQCRLVAYKDSGGVWTIGYGHTGASVKEGLKITEHQADVLFDYDLDRTETDVSALVSPGATDNEYAACVSLVFNAGPAEFRTSHLLSKLNSGDIAGAADEFRDWNHVKGRVNKGLTRRREAERTLFLQPDPHDP